MKYVVSLLLLLQINLGRAISLDSAGYELLEHSSSIFESVQVTEQLRLGAGCQHTDQKKIEDVSAPTEDKKKATSNTPQTLPQNAAKLTVPVLKKLENVEVIAAVSSVERDAAIQKVVTKNDSYITKELAKKTDVHHTDSYYKPLWKGLNIPEIMGYGDKNSSEFRELFTQTVKEVQFVIQHLNTDKEVRVGAVDMVLKLPEGYKKAKIEQAFIKMRELGKHSGSSDWDSEIQAHVNEVFVYVWQEVKLDPKSKLQEFFVQLGDAGPTCIQGHTIRMLQSVHDYSLRDKFFQVRY